MGVTSKRQQNGDYLKVLGSRRRVTSPPDLMEEFVCQALTGGMSLLSPLPSASLHRRLCWANFQSDLRERRVQAVVCRADQHLLSLQLEEAARLQLSLEHQRAAT